MSNKTINCNKKESSMFGLFGKSENETEIRHEIDKKIAETKEAFQVSRSIYDTFGLPDGDYYTAFEGFSEFVDMWVMNGFGQRNSKLQLKLIRKSLNTLHKQRTLIASNLTKQYGYPDKSKS
jgi:hypothetical protein